MDSNRPYGPGSSWNRYELLVLNELKNLREGLKELEDAQRAGMEQLRLELTALKVKSAVWGSIAGVGVGGFVSLVVGLVLRSLRV